MRAGWIFAHDAKQYGQWRQQAQTGGGTGLSGANLETHVRGLLITARRLVAMPGETPRRMRANA